MSPDYSADGILSQLDNYAMHFDFPVLNNVHLRLADTKLNIFRSSEEWLMVFEIIAYDVRAHEFVNTIYAFGNKLLSPGFQTSVEIMREAVGFPLEDEEGNSIIDIQDFTVLINDTICNYHPTQEQMLASGIEQPAEMPSEAQLLRLVCFLEPNRFFIPQAELLLLLRKSYLAGFMDLYDWHHPDVAQGEIPSQNSCFQSLAESIAR